MCIFKKLFLVPLLGLFIAGGLVACGDSTRNDQGVSLSFFGWFADASGDVGLAGVNAPLSALRENPGSVYGVPWGLVDSDGEPLGAQAFAGVRSNLLAESVRIERIHHSFYVPGAAAQPPTTSAAAPCFLPSTGGGPGVGFDPVGAMAEEIGESVCYIGADMVPFNIVQWLNLNRHQLPEAPFTVVVTSYLSGVTSAGRVLNTNSVDIEVQFAPDNVILPTPGGAAVAESVVSPELVEED